MWWFYYPGFLIDTLQAAIGTCPHSKLKINIDHDWQLKSYIRLTHSMITDLFQSVTYAVLQGSTYLDLTIFFTCTCIRASHEILGFRELVA